MSLKIRVTITEVATGKQKTKVQDYKYPLDRAIFYYTEGNGSCNCNLAFDFDGDDNNQCIDGREFTAVVEEVEA